MQPAASTVSHATAASLLGGLFFLVALVLGGGVVGLTVGVPLDKALHPNPHGLPGLGGLLVGVPAGALLGLGLGLVGLRRLSHAQRLRFGLFVLIVGAACALGLWGSVLLGVMRW